MIKQIWDLPHGREPNSDTLNDTWLWLRTEALHTVLWVTSSSTWWQQIDTHSQTLDRIWGVLWKSQRKDRGSQMVKRSAQGFLPNLTKQQSLRTQPFLEDRGGHEACRHPPFLDYISQEYPWAQCPFATYRQEKSLPPHSLKTNQFKIHTVPPIILCLVAV